MPATVRNVAREKLEQGQLSLGDGVRMTRSVEIAKAMAVAGFDWQMNRRSLSITAKSKVGGSRENLRCDHARYPGGDTGRCAQDGGALMTYLDLDALPVSGSSCLIGMITGAMRVVANGCDPREAKVGQA
jgi:hypothetical protein